LTEIGAQIFVTLPSRWAEKNLALPKRGRNGNPSPKFTLLALLPPIINDRSLTILTRLSKKAYYTKYFEDNLFNTKKTWEGINNLINRKRKNSKHITSLRCPKRNILSSNASEFPNIFNKHFSSIGHKLASKMPNSSTSFHEYLSNSTNPFSFAFNYVSPKELELEIMAIPLNK
jgi:hypothetical protein